MYICQIIQKLHILLTINNKNDEDCMNILNSLYLKRHKLLKIKKLKLIYEYINILNNVNKVKVKVLNQRILFFIFVKTKNKKYFLTRFTIIF